MCVANAQCIEFLKQLPLGDIILVTGAGPSSPGCCMMKELVDAVAGACHCEPPLDPQRAHEFFEKAHDLDANQYYATVKDKFSPPFAADPKVYGVLVAVQFRAYITLNHDPLLPQTMIRSRGDITGQFTYYPQPIMFRPYDLHSHRLVAVHGFADENEPEWERKLVLRSSDYLNAYTNIRNANGTGGLLDWWCQVLSQYRCLFVGTSLNEPGIISAIDYLLKDSNPFQGQRHVCLVPLDPGFPKDQPPPELAPLFETIQRVSYHPEDPRHRGLLRVWQEVAQISDPRIPVRRGIVPELRLDESGRPER
jgi:hypothetical protein